MESEVQKKEFPKLQSIERISKIPVVETSVQYATGMYSKIRNSNALIRWSLGSVEGGIQIAVEKSLVAVPLLEMPLFIVDALVCKSLDTVETRVPAINYPPELLINMTKDIVSARIVQPAIKRVDSVKKFGVNGASKYTEIAASRLDTALNVADKYVDKYLPDASDCTDSAEQNRRDSTIEHVNRFSRKLQRRLTKRTIAEAKALKKQGVDVAQCLLYLLDLLVKDPKQFAEKMKAVWAYLSEDEPENQIPPANLEQLIGMLTREMARRFVHLINFTVLKISKMPTYTVQAVNIGHHHLAVLFDQVIKTVHLEGAKAIAAARARNEIETLQGKITQYYHLLEHLLSNLGSRLPQPATEVIALEPLPPKESETKVENDENLVNHEIAKKHENSSENHQPKKKKNHKNHSENVKKEEKIPEGDENFNKTSVTSET